MVLLAESQETASLFTRAVWIQKAMAVCNPRAMVSRVMKAEMCVEVRGGGKRRNRVVVMRI